MNSKKIFIAFILIILSCKIIELNSNPDKEKNHLQNTVKRTGEYPNYTYTLPDGSYVQREAGNYYAENLLDAIPHECTKEEYDKLEAKYNWQEKIIFPGTLTKSAKKK